MDERATGIILRTRPLTETSLIVLWLTREHGRIATVAKGARRPKSSFRGKLDLYFACDFTFARSRRSELHTLREASLRNTHEALRHDLAKLHQAAYCARLLEQATEVDTPLPRLFDLFAGLLAHLAVNPPTPEIILAFEMKFLRESGLAPELNEASQSEGALALLRKLTDEDWSFIARLKASGAQLRELQQFLHGFLIYHLGKLPSGRSGALGG
jgi:DNA repair protein RecO (recombination protein O)